MQKIGLLITAIGLLGSLQARAAIADPFPVATKQYSCVGTNNNYELEAKIKITRVTRVGNEGTADVTLASATAEERFYSTGTALLLGSIPMLSTLSEPASFEVKYIAHRDFCGRGACSPGALIYKTVATLKYRGQEFVFDCSKFN